MEIVALVSRRFWTGKRVLITGHTGFKGAWLSLWLHSLGAEVCGFALAPPTDPNLYQLTYLVSQFRSVIGDVRDRAALQNALTDFQPEIIFHLAAQSLVRESYASPVDTYATNVMGTVHLLEVARSLSNLQAIVIVTSDKCYDNREWPWAYRENDAMGGHDPYSSSKGCAELVSAAYYRSFFAPKSPHDSTGRVGLASARAGNVIGGGDWAADRLMPDCARAFSQHRSLEVRNPHSVRPWQHVLEPLRGYLLLAQKLWHTPHEFSRGWNFGPASGDARPVSFIADFVARAWGNDVTWRHVTVDAPDRLSAPASVPPHEATYLRLDCSLAAQALGWTPLIDLEQALRWTVDWYVHFYQGGDVREKTFEQLEAFQLLEAARNPI